MSAAHEEQPFLSLRDAVFEIRSDVKDLRVRLERIDREGSIGTRTDLDDHERRLRELERAGWRTAGAWATVVLVFSSIVALAGLAVAVFAAVTNV